MAALLPLSQQSVPIPEGGHILLTVVNYTASGDTVNVDSSVLLGQAYTFSLEPGGTNPVTTSNNGVTAGSGTTSAYVTIGSDTTGTTGKVLVVTRHSGNISLGSNY